MFEIGDRVVYSTHGVCTVTGIEDRTVDQRRIRYFVLEPGDGGGTFYVPMHNQTALAKLRRLITREELEALLDSGEVQQADWVQDENRRKQLYRELIGSGDIKALLSMIRNIHLHRKAQTAQGRRLHLCDENFLRDGEKLLDSELTRVLDMSPTEVHAYLSRAMERE